MQDVMLPGRSLGRIAIVVLLIIQCILGDAVHLPSASERSHRTERNKRMERSTPLSNSQTQGHTSKAGSTQQKTRRIRTGIAITLWFIGLMLLASASVLIRNHPGPWP